jgi:ribosomal protein S18 acetylase RimI-like enzyme
VETFAYSRRDSAGELVTGADRSARDVTAFTCVRRAPSGGSATSPLADKRVNVQRRAATDADRDFLFDLHKSALGPYVEATWGWDEAFQRRWFEERFDPPANQIVLVDDVPAGCVRVSDREECVFLDYIAMVPEQQRRGLGSAVVLEIMRDATSRELPVRLNVLKVNPAKGLYERLGFRVSGDDDVRWFMEYAG